MSLEPLGQEVRPPTRRLLWVPSTCHSLEIDKLELAMASYYSTHSSYYSDIDFTAEHWGSPAQPVYTHVLHCADDADRVCEIGCGQANVLRYFPRLAPCYTGIDFSQTVLQRNETLHPKARFVKAVSSSHIPLPSNSFSLVFSTYVLEHVCRPAAHLQECLRILRPGGLLIILCPDYSRRCIPSQRLGFSPGSGRDKLLAGKAWDALVTGFDSRVRVPTWRRWLRWRQGTTPSFLVNLAPRCFTDPFEPDCDAVYLTDRREITTLLRQSCDLQPVPEDVTAQENRDRLIFLKFRKHLAAGADGVS